MGLLTQLCAARRAPLCSVEQNLQNRTVLCTGLESSSLVQCRKTKLLKIFKKITASCAVWQHSGPLASFLSNIQQGYAQEAQKVRAGVQ